MNEFWQVFTGLFSNSFFSALSGAVTGGFFTLWGARQQANRQRAMDEEKREREEENKLRYLLFLVEDIHTIIRTYSQSATNFADSVNQNPYVIPDMSSHPSYSLEAVVSKINQEEYYLAALKRLNNPEFLEIFRMLAALETTYSRSRAHYNREFPLLIDDKMAFANSANDIPGILMDFLNCTFSVTKSSTRDLYDEFVTLFNTYPEKSHPTRLLEIDSQFARLKERFKDETYDNGRHWKMLSESIDKSKRYRSRISNVTQAIIRNRDEMNRVIGLISPHADVLRAYIISLNTPQIS